MTHKNRQSDNAGFSENTLLARYRNGDPDAFYEVVNHYRDAVYTLIRRCVSDREVAEDVFQATFLHLYTSQSSIDQDLPLKPLLYTIAANTARITLNRLQHQSAMNAAECPAYVEG